jgi:hypothetical protein
VKQLNDGPKPVYKVGFIREKGRLQLGNCSGAWKPVARCSGEDWGFYGHSNSLLGGGVLIVHAFHGLSQVNWFGLHLYWGKGTILRAFCLSALWQIYQALYLFFSMQECRPPSPQNAGMLLLSMGDGILTHLP